MAIAPRQAERVLRTRLRFLGGMYGGHWAAERTWHVKASFLSRLQQMAEPAAPVHAKVIICYGTRCALLGPACKALAGGGGSGTVSWVDHVPRRAVALHARVAQSQQSLQDIIATAERPSPPLRDQLAMAVAY